MTDLAGRLERVLGAAVTSLERVRGRGYTAAGRYRVALEDGRQVFAKVGVEELTAGWLREEHLVYEQIQGPFIPSLLGWDDDGAAPILVLPDLGDTFDAPPWTDERIAAVQESLRLLRDSAPPADLPRVERFEEMRGRWDLIAADPVAFLSVGVCSRTWLDANVGVLQAAAPPRSRVKPSSTSTCGATTSHLSTGAQSLWTGTGARAATPRSTSRRGCRRFRPRAGRSRTLSTTGSAS